MTLSPDNIAPTRPRTGRATTPRWVEVAVVSMLLALYGVLAYSSTTHKSVTFDELPHIAGGVSFWETGDYRLQPENGHLPQRIAGLGAMAAGAHLDWRAEPEWKVSDVWLLGDKLIFPPQADPFVLVQGARLAMTFVGVAICLGIYLWSRRLWGLPGAMLSLLLAALCPNLLTHGPLATSDATATLFFLLTLASAWALLHRVSPLRVLVVGASSAGLALAKMSAPLVIPMIVIALVARVAIGLPLPATGFASPVRSRVAQLVLLVVALLSACLLAVAFVWAVYGFRFSPMDPGDPGQLLPGWDRVLQAPVRLYKPILWVRDRHLLPETLLYGYAHVAWRSVINKQFFFGDFRLEGWREYFPVAFLIKTPLPTLLLLLLSLGLGLRALFPISLLRPRATLVRFYRVVPLLALLVVYWTVAINSTMNIGFRHILPTLPAFYILAGASARWALRARVRTLAVGAMLVWLAVTTAFIRPHFLAYFNPLVGGPSNGYKCLVDSSLDWGQDLPGLADWLRQNAPPGPDRPPVYLSYFGTGDPKFYGVDAIRLLGSTIVPRPTRRKENFSPGIYCLSATQLQCIYQIPGRWSLWHEAQYQELMHLDQQLADPVAGPVLREKILRDQGPNAINDATLRYGELRFGRLCAMLRQREPIAQIGYSINIYRLTAEDLKHALLGPPAELLSKTTPPGR